MRSAVAVVGLNHQPRPGAQLTRALHTTHTRVAATPTATSQPLPCHCSERAPANIPVRSFISISLEHPRTSEFQSNPTSTAPIAPTEVKTSNFGHIQTSNTTSAYVSVLTFEPETEQTAQTELERGQLGLLVDFSNGLVANGLVDLEWASEPASWYDTHADTNTNTTGYSLQSRRAPPSLTRDPLSRSTRGVELPLLTLTQPSYLYYLLVSPYTLEQFDFLATFLSAPRPSSFGYIHHFLHGYKEISIAITYIQAREACQLLVLSDVLQRHQYFLIIE